MSVCPSVVNTIASEHKELQTLKCYRLLLPIRWLVLKIGYIGPQNLVPPISTQLVYRDLGHMETAIRTKFDVQALNNTTKNNRHRSTGSGTSHISQIGKRGLEHMERPIHTKFDVQACILTLNNTTKNFRHQSTGSGASQISQISIRES